MREIDIARKFALAFNEGIVNALSTTTGALEIEAVQTGGWLVTKDAE